MIFWHWCVDTERTRSDTSESYSRWWHWTLLGVQRQILGGSGKTGLGELSRHHVEYSLLKQTTSLRIAKLPGNNPHDRQHSCHYLCCYQPSLVKLVVVVHCGQWTLRTVDPFASKGLKAFVCCRTSSDKCRNSCNMGNNNQYHSRTHPLAGYKMTCFLSWIILFSYKRRLRVFCPQSPL
jgi:hypothetical protein